MTVGLNLSARILQQHVALPSVRRLWSKTFHAKLYVISLHIDLVHVIFRQS